MSPDQIQHFLVILEEGADEPSVESFGSDYEAAQDAYAAAEREGSLGRDVVLLSADSLETLKETHSSYFTKGSVLRELLPG